MVLAQRNQEHPEDGRGVSIPLWFSLNLEDQAPRRSGLQFPSHYGSRSTGREILARSRPPVSIPLWFSLNWTGLAFLLMVICFHPTMVLAQRERRESAGSSSAFPSHYGSRSTSWRLFILFRTCFHPTMVLAQQDNKLRKRHGYISFHPTMVLAQLEFGNYLALQFRFHPTMVLAQRTNRPLTVDKRVSIPLWFSLNEFEGKAATESTRFHPTMVLAQRE